LHCERNHDDHSLSSADQPFSGELVDADRTAEQPCPMVANDSSKSHFEQVIGVEGQELPCPSYSDCIRDIELFFSRK